LNPIFYNKYATYNQGKYKMGLKTIRYKITKRWLPSEFDTYDEYGTSIRTPNPHPLVDIMTGIWSREDGDVVLKTMAGIDFSRMTGRIIHGGSIEKPGIQTMKVDERIYNLVMKRVSSGTSDNQKPKRVLPKPGKNQKSKSRVIIRRKSR
jgi:hypothetical protein